MFALPISMPRLKSNTFYQNSPKINLFLQNAKSSSAGASAPIANFWLRACQEQCNAAFVDITMLQEVLNLDCAMTLCFP